MNGEKNMAQSSDPKLVLRTVLSEIGWTPEPDSSDTNLFVDLRVPDSPVSFAHVAISPELERFVLHLNFARVVPSDRRDECAHLITRINWELMIGNFGMDYSDGHVRFKASIDFSGTQLTSQLIRNVILASMQAVDCHAGSITDVIEGDIRTRDLDS